MLHLQQSQLLPITEMPHWYFPENELDEIKDDDIDWDRIPVGFYPANEEEAIARIEAAEAAYERGEYMDAKEFDKELKAKYPWLA